MEIEDGQKQRKASRFWHKEGAEVLGRELLMQIKLE